MTLIWTDNPQAAEAGGGWLDGDIQGRADAGHFQVYVCGPGPQGPIMTKADAMAMAHAILAFYNEADSGRRQA